MGEAGCGMQEESENPRDAAQTPATHPEGFPPLTLIQHPAPALRYRRVREVRHGLRQLLHLRSVARAPHVTLELRCEPRQRVVARRSRRTLGARDILTNRRDAGSRKTFAAL